MSSRLSLARSPFSSPIISSRATRLPALPYSMMRPGASNRMSGAVPAVMAEVRASGPDWKSMVSTVIFTSGLAAMKASASSCS